MDLGMTREALSALGMDGPAADALLGRLFALAPGASSAEIWTAVSTGALSPEVPHAVHRALYDRVFADWDARRAPRPAWTPPRAVAEASNVAAACRRLGLRDYAALHAWSVNEREAFWRDTIEALDIPFRTPPRATADLSAGPKHPRWLPGARMNAADACFLADPGATAVVYRREGHALARMTYGELDTLSNRVAGSLGSLGVGTGDAVAIAMPMTVEAVAAYLGILKAGAVVVSIADSFASEEIATRLRISGARVAVTQDVVLRAGKTLPMYQKVVDAGAERAIVVPAADDFAVALRPSDRAWASLLSGPERFETVARSPDDNMNVLFSSGTTGEPKAIPWSHTTAVKCAMDGYYHHDIHPGQVVAWPTNIGWMMGPWLVFASLVNRAVMALYYGAPNTRGFCAFVQDAGVNMLGVVPSLVKAWRGGDMTRGLDWSAIKAFSSTGEASNPDDYLWLMARAGYRPVVEYCGGTEIGGGYV
ncbi:MAG: AMP-binding protein, partial [Candidatus Krumholzibacteria bacterium]|nr:AMP-binding protein [Candidatus Krumholzibacteria bacterium]